MQTDQPLRAVVVGASIAGLVASRVLSDHVDEVVIVERDAIDDQAVARPGVPQAIHVHVLLRRGYLEFARLFPSFDRRLTAAGGLDVDLLRDGVWILPFGTAPRGPSRLRTRSATRALLEGLIRELTLERTNVRLLDRHEVIGLAGTATAVRGVTVRPRPARTGERDGESFDLDAWLVVDASGRTSKAPAHLAAIGAPVPDETVVDASLRYATRLYRVPRDPRDWKVLLVRDRPPAGTRGGGVYEVEGGRWVVTLGGAGTDQPPTDEGGFLDFARSLISPRLHDEIREAEPLTPVRGWARTGNRWRHVERIRQWPAGFALVGDAMCALNPVYGQGMSVAAMEGGVLAAWLETPGVRRARRSAATPDTRELVRALARTARLPWFLAVGEDARVEGVTGAAPPGRIEALGRRYVDEVLLHAMRDTHTLRRFTEVSNLVRPPLALLDPMVASRVVAGVLKRRLGGRS